MPLSLGICDCWERDFMTKVKPETTLFFTDQSIGFFHRQPKDPIPEIHGQTSLDKGIIEKGNITDPFRLLDKLRALFKKNKIRPQNVRFVINSQNIMSRVLDIPKSEVSQRTIPEYLHSQLGKSLHFPFSQTKLSHQVFAETPTHYRVILIAADEKLLNDYLDVFDRLNVKNVVFDIPSLSMYNLLITQNEEPFGNLMFIAVYQTYFTLKIFENDVLVFNLIEELEGTDSESNFAQIENYVERIANYYRYNLHKGDQSIDNVMFVNFDEQTDDLRFEKNFGTNSGPLPHRVFHFVSKDGEKASWPRPVLLAYAASVEKNPALKNISTLDFHLDRPRKIAKFLIYLMAASVAIFSGISLIAIPLATSNEEIAIQQYENQTLQTLLDRLNSDLAALPSFSTKEKNYSNAFDDLEAREVSLTPYFEDLFAELNDYVVLADYRVDCAERIIVLTIDPATTPDLNEFVIALYEAHGVVSGETDADRWISEMPETKVLNPGLIEVTFHVA
jgi:type IV pilus assembly protein PilM